MSDGVIVICIVALALMCGASLGAVLTLRKAA